MKKTSDILLVIIVILIIAGAMFFDMQKKKVDVLVVENTALIENTAITPLDTKTATSTPVQAIPTLIEPSEEIDTSNWKTYKNEEFGFEVKYQPYWELATYGYVGEVTDEKFIPKLFNEYNSDQKDSTPLLNFTIFEKPPTDSMNRYLKQDKYIKDEIINKVRLKIFKGSNFFGFSYSAIITLDNVSFSIRVSQIENENEAWNRFEQILSTFRFLK